jgi:transposase
MLDLADLGFEGVDPAATGRPAYHPSVLLKLYIYGYLNRVQSSRRLEREAGRNLEVIWLLGRLVPDDNVIADCRKDNGPAIRRACGRFVNLCRQMGLLAKASVAIDGSKFKAVNNRDRNFTRGKIDRRRAQLEESVARYLFRLDTADRQEPSDVLVLKTTRQGKARQAERGNGQRPGKRAGIDNCLRTGLATDRLHRMCGIADQRDAAERPCRNRIAIDQWKFVDIRDCSINVCMSSHGNRRAPNAASTFSFETRRFQSSRSCAAFGSVI